MSALIESGRAVRALREAEEAIRQRNDAQASLGAALDRAAKAESRWRHMDLLFALAVERLGELRVERNVFLVPESVRDRIEVSEADDPMTGETVYRARRRAARGGRDHE